MAARFSHGPASIKIAVPFATAAACSPTLRDSGVVMARNADLCEPMPPGRRTPERSEAGRRAAQAAAAATLAISTPITFSRRLSALKANVFVSSIV